MKNTWGSILSFRQFSTFEMDAWKSSPTVWSVQADMHMIGDDS